LSPADAVRLGEALEGMRAALERLAAVREEHGPPLREIIVSSILPSGLRFASEPGSAVELSFMTISPTEWEGVQTASRRNEAYVSAAALGAAPVSFQGVPVFDMDKADAGKSGVAAAARAEAIRYAIADRLARGLSL